MAEPVISEIRYRGGADVDFVEVAIPDDYDDPENLVVVIYDLADNGSATGTPSTDDQYFIQSDGAVDPAGSDGTFTRYIIGFDFSGDAIALNRNDAVGLYNTATGETFGLYTFDTGDTYTVSSAALNADGSGDPDPFAGQTAVTLDTTNGTQSLELQTDGSYLVISPPSPYSGPICFGEGTRIETENGEIPIEELSVGDRVVTKDRGNQVIRWIGTRRIALTDANFDRLRPYVVAAGAFGDGVPNADLRLSPEHLILFDHALTEIMFSVSEALISAKSLGDHPKIKRSSKNIVDYWHLSTGAHDLVRANGLWVETLYLGKEAWSRMTRPQKQEIVSIFPDVFGQDLDQIQKCRLEFSRAEAAAASAVLM
ncbi:MAG: Hint domain-containing protein [Pseudomonadota bacterium]